MRAVTARPLVRELPPITEQLARVEATREEHGA
jgi:hypothetical protein